MKQRGEVLAVIPLNLDGYLFKWESGRHRGQVAYPADFTGWKRNNDKFEKQLENVVRLSEPTARHGIAAEAEAVMDASRPEAAFFVASSGQWQGGGR